MSNLSVVLKEQFDTLLSKIMQSDGSEPATIQIETALEEFNSLVDNHILKADKDGLTESESTVLEILIERFKRMDCNSYFEDHLADENGTKYYLTFGLHSGERPVEQLRNAQHEVSELRAELSLLKAKINS